MSDEATLGDDDRRELLQMLGQYDVPAYVRRGRAVEEAYERLLARCARVRDEYLMMVRLRLARLAALAGEWEALRPLVEEEQLEELGRLHDELKPTLRAPVEATTSRRTLRRALGELSESVARFNRRWRAFLEKLGLAEVNELREGYNRYYLLEKEC